MRKLFLVLLAVLFIAGIAFAEAGSRTSPGRGEIVQMPYQSDPPKKFRLVRNTGTASGTGIAADSIVVWDTTVDDGVSILTTTVSCDSSVAGILATAIVSADVTDNTAVQDIGKGNWAWLQTYGIAQVNVSLNLTNPLVKSAMGTGTTAGEAAPFYASTSNSTLNGNAGFFFDAATAGDDDVQCFIRTE